MKKLVLSMIAVLSIVSISVMANDKKKDDKKAAPAAPATKDAKKK